MKIAPRVRTGALAALLAAAAVQAAPMYKWVDEKGNVQYSQLPPPDGKAQTIAAPPPSPISDEEANKQLQDAQKALTAEDAEAKKAAQADKARSEQDKQNCENARKNIELYSDPAVRRFRQPDGSVQIPSEEERTARIKEMKQAVEKYCNAPAANKDQPAAK